VQEDPKLDVEGVLGVGGLGLGGYLGLAQSLGKFFSKGVEVVS
jgi:hypothetical protein